MSWVKYQRRSDLLARYLDAPLYNVVWGQRGKLWQAPFRYIVQGWRSWRIMRRDRPDVILAENPPIFNVLVAYLYAFLHRKHIVLDSHTGSFISEKWERFMWLHRWLARRAITTIITNDYLKSIVESWNAHPFILGYVPGEYPEGEPYPLEEGAFNVVYVCSFAEDEPLEEVIEVARQLPDVNFYVTGNSKKVAPQKFANKPDNFILTGYISYDLYIGLLRGTDAVMCLTTRNHTLLMGGFEAISLKVPLVTSNWDILKQYFRKGTVHTDNSISGLRDGIQQAKQTIDTMRSEMAEYSVEADQEAEEIITQFKMLLASRVNQ